VRFFTGLFFLDLAGLLAVTVYEASPFPMLQETARIIRDDEGRHVHSGRDFLLRVAATTEGRQQLDRAAAELLPLIDAFFGGDDSPVQRTLLEVGIRTTSNSALKQRFHDKARALLHLRMA
jgi:1,2-phenylacetyl-CoA epoxidase catalytic subunit